MVFLDPLGKIMLMQLLDMLSLKERHRNVYCACFDTNLPMTSSFCLPDIGKCEVLHNILISSFHPSIYILYNFPCHFHLSRK
jgi:hypothetical protein